MGDGSPMGEFLIGYNPIASALVSNSVSAPARISRISVVALGGCPDYNCTMGELEIAISMPVEGV